MPAPEALGVAQALRAKGFTSRVRQRDSGVYQFFSFDLVNSTLFKAQHPDIWPIVVTRFYEILQSILSTSNISARLWKYVGDEVLFYKRVRTAGQLVDALSIALKALRATEIALHGQYPQTKELLSIKGTTWLALAEYLPPSAIDNVHSEHRNIIVASGRRPELYERDFLGPDIDIGFRISKYSLRRRLVVSAHLAAVIFAESSASMRLERHFRIVSYEKLKGVWADRFYPIIWFEDSWEGIDRSFLYDELLVSEIAGKAIKAGASSDLGLAAVEKVFTDLGKDSEITSIRSALSAQRSDQIEEPEFELPIFKYAEVHCAAVCFGTDGKVLAAKRLPSKRRFPNAFEFGCGQLKLGESFSDCLRRSYREDFGVNIVIPDTPIPVASYTIFDAEEERRIPGIVFWARIEDNADAVEARYVKEKHASIQWFDPDNLPADSPDFVPDFRNTVLRARTLEKQEEEARATGP